jgi:hypothetical protein
VRVWAEYSDGQGACGERQRCLDVLLELREDGSGGQPDIGGGMGSGEPATLGFEVASGDPDDDDPDVDDADDVI